MKINKCIVPRRLHPCPPAIPRPSSHDRPHSKDSYPQIIIKVSDRGDAPPEEESFNFLPAAAPEKRRAMSNSRSRPAPKRSLFREEDAQQRLRALRISNRNDSQGPPISASMSVINHSSKVQDLRLLPSSGLTGKECRPGSSRVARLGPNLLPPRYPKKGAVTRPKDDRSNPPADRDHDTSALGKEQTLTARDMSLGGGSFQCPPLRSLRHGKIFREQAMLKQQSRFRPEVGRPVEPATASKGPGTSRIAFYRAEERAGLPLVILQFEGTLGDVQCQAVFNAGCGVSYYVRAGCDKAVKTLLARCQVAVVRTMRDSRYRPFREHFAKRGIIFDAEYKDRRGSARYPQDYTQILRDFSVSQPRYALVSSLG